MQDVKLYISGQRVHLSEREAIALTKQVNSLGDMKNRQADFSNMFTVPATKENRLLFGFSDMLNSLSRTAYTKLPAKVVIDGIDVIPNGYAIIEASREEESFDISVYSGIVSFFSRIENKLLADLDWSDMEENWEVATMPLSMKDIYYFNKPRKRIFPLIQYGELPSVGQSIDVRYQSPALFLREAIDRIITQAGYTYSGDIFSDPFYNNIVIPGTLPFGKTEKFVQDRTAIIGTTTFAVQMTLDDGEEQTIKVPFARYSKYMGFPGTLTAGSKTVTGMTANNVYFLDPQMKVTAPGLPKNTVIESIEPLPLPFPNIYLSEPALQSGTQTLQFDVGMFGDGDAGCWDPVTQVYTADDYYSVDVKVKIWFRVTGSQSCDSTVFVRKNGVDIFNLNTHHTSGGTIFDFADFGIRNPKDPVTLEPGDTLEVFLKFRNTPGEGIAQIFIQPEDKPSLEHTPTNDNTRLEIIPRLELIPGSSFNTIDYLPELNQKDVMKDFLQRFCVLVEEDTVANHLRFKTFKALGKSMGEAVNLSDKLILNRRPKLSFRFKDYGQKNNFVNQEDDLNKDDENKDGIIGDYYFNIEDEALQVEKDVIESIYAGSNTETVLDTLTIARIPIWENQEVQYDSKPRLLALRGENKTVTFYSPTIKGPSGSVEWSAIPGGAGNNLLVGYFLDSEEPQDLGWQSLIENYYQEWIQCLTNCKILQVQFDINAIDYYAFDLLLPVWIEYFNEYFYINKIQEFQGIGGEGTTFELVRL
jgi:hypothetical protein